MLFVHIGTHKTGTSALQSALTYGEDDLLANGVHYLRAGREDANAHHKLAWSARGKKNIPLSIWEGVRAELDASESAVNILSSEGFWFTDPEHVRRELGTRNDVRIVLYLRRQDKYLQSLYKQALAGGKRNVDFQSWLEQRGGRGDYLLVVQQWAEQFGRDALIIRPYERDGKTIDVVEDFMNVIGLDIAVLSRRTHGSRNPSPRRELAELIRAFNQVGADIDRQKFFSLLMKGKAQYMRSADLLDYEACRRLLANYADSNRVLSEEFYRDPATPLFPELAPFTLPEFWEPDQPEYFDMLVDMMTAVVRAVAPPDVEDTGKKKKGKHLKKRQRET